MIYAVIQFESRAVSVKTVRCHCKLLWMWKFTVASLGPPCDSI